MGAAPSSMPFPFPFPPLQGGGLARCIHLQQALIENDYPLFDAASDGDIRLVKSMIREFRRQGRAVQDIRHGNSNQNVLHVSAACGKKRLCKFLIKQVKLDINVRDGAGQTPLHLAILNQHISTAKYLIGNGADVNAKTMTLKTPLHYAVEDGSEELLKLLLLKGAEVNAMAYRGTALHIAAYSSKKEFVEILLDNHADPNAVSFHCSTPLMETALAKSLECLELLLKMGADPNPSCSNVMSPLWDAAGQGWNEAVESLLGDGADPNFINIRGLKPIEIAARRGYHHTVGILFPLTKRIPKISHWTIDGIISHAQSDEADQESLQKLKESFFLSKSKAEEAFNEEDYYSAIKWYSEAQRCCQDRANMVCRKSLCWARLGEGGNALEEARMGATLDPDLPEVYYRMGSALMILKDFEKAADGFARAYAMDRGNQEYYRAFLGALEARNEEIPDKANGVPIDMPLFEDFGSKGDEIFARVGFRPPRF